MRKVIDKTGQRFGRLVVIRVHEKSHSGHLQWQCMCDCGNETIATGTNLVSGNTSSCGCLREEKRFTTLLTHGHTSGRGRSRTYGCWRNMKTRVLNKEGKDYKYYGARGITICDRWMKFKNFLEDMGEAPEDLTLERLDNDGNYCKENCRWATHTRQGRNRRNVRLSMEKARTIRSDPRSHEDIADAYGVGATTVRNVKIKNTWKENQRLF